MIVVENAKSDVSADAIADEAAMIEEDVAMAQEDDWAKVQAALADPKWDFRTVEGIARDSHLDSRNVERLLRSNRSEIRQTFSRDRRIIYTLKSRPKKLREVFANVQALLS